MRRRKFELPTYFFIILYFIVSNAFDGDDGGRRPPVEGPKAPHKSHPIYPPSTPIGKEGDSLGPSYVDVGAKQSNSSGTAFAYDGLGQYVTARHVTEGCSLVYVMTGPRSGKRGTVRAMNDSDFSVITVHDLKAPRVEIAATKPRRGDVGYFMGYPGGDPADVVAEAYGASTMRSVGRYSFREPVTVWWIKERRPAPSTAGLYSEGYYNLAGLSGGPAFNANGEIIGTVVAGQPRRARMITTDLRNFDRFSALTPASKKAVSAVKPALTFDNFDSIGKKLRKDLTIAKVYCKVQ